MIAVTFALPSESRDFARLLDPGQREIAILHTGVGAKIAERRMAAFLDRQRFDFVLSSGFAGGVDPSLEVGDLLLANNYSDPELLDRARQLLICQVARLVTTDRIVESRQEREEFARQHRAVAVDMETQSIAQACVARQIPLLSLRVISDTTAAPFPAPPEVLFDLERQRTPSLRLLGHLLRRPSRIVRLKNFARQVALARRNLAVALDLVIRETNYRPAS